MSILDGDPTSSTSQLDPIAAVIKNPFSTTVKSGGLRPADFPGGFQIIEYVNGKAVTSTQLRLVGNMMPMQPFTWAGEQRMVEEYYPGNPEPAVQILGGKEDPITIKGRFKDKRYKDPSYYGVAYQYNLAINEMRKRGNLVKFGMHGIAGNFFRWGFIKRGEFKMNKLSWIDYEIEFLVVSYKQPKNNYFAAPEKKAPQDVNQNLINAAANFTQNYSSVPKTMPLSIAGLMNNITGAVAANLKVVTGFVNTILSTAQSIEDSANRAIGLIKNTRNFLYQTRTKIGQLENGFNSISGTIGPAAKQTIAAYKNMQYLHETAASTITLSQYLAQMQVQFEQIAKTVPKARYKVQIGDTLQRISVKFYGVADDWNAIYTHNNLTTTALTPGQILEIPNL